MNDQIDTQVLLPFAMTNSSSTMMILTPLVTSVEMDDGSTIAHRFEELENIKNLDWEANPDAPTTINNTCYYWGLHADNPRREIYALCMDLLYNGIVKTIEL